MPQPPRGHASSGRVESTSGSPPPRPRTAADLDAVVKEFAGRVARLERELAELRQVMGRVMGQMKGQMTGSEIQ